MIDTVILFPGIVMSMYTLLRQNFKPKMKELEEAFQGNLCRCTGYRPIIEGYKTFTEEWELKQNLKGSSNGMSNGSCAMGAKCCKLGGKWYSHEDSENVEIASLYRVPNG